uniref:SCP domain-containing protein n=1 Tax=Mesocestoides corti TaxID=53468 RepID=A0A5K3G5N9_MESCO
MQLMHYSLELENLAKQAAELRCAGSGVDPSVHTQFQGCGIIANSDNRENKSIVDNLSAIYELEKPANSHDTNICKGYCLDSKTMMRSQTTAVGCTTEACQDGKSVFTVCIYKPGEFDPQDRPYEKGQSCSKCHSGFACYRNQCKEPSTTVPTTSSATIASAFRFLSSLMLVLQRCLIVDTSVV